MIKSNYHYVPSSSKLLEDANNKDEFEDYDEDDSNTYESNLKNGQTTQASILTSVGQSNAIPITKRSNSHTHESNLIKRNNSIKQTTQTSKNIGPETAAGLISGSNVKDTHANDDQYNEVDVNGKVKPKNHSSNLKSSFKRILNVGKQKLSPSQLINNSSSATRKSFSEHYEQANDARTQYNHTHHNSQHHQQDKLNNSFSGKDKIVYRFKKMRSLSHTYDDTKKHHKNDDEDKDDEDGYSYRNNDYKLESQSETDETTNEDDDDANDRENELDSLFKKTNKSPHKTSTGSMNFLSKSLEDKSAIVTAMSSKSPFGKKPTESNNQSHKDSTLMPHNNLTTASGSPYKMFNISDTGSSTSSTSSSTSSASASVSSGTSSKSSSSLAQSNNAHILISSSAAASAFGATNGSKCKPMDSVLLKDLSNVAKRSDSIRMRHNLNMNKLNSGMPGVGNELLIDNNSPNVIVSADLINNIANKSTIIDNMDNLTKANEIACAASGGNAAMKSDELFKETQSKSKFKRLSKKRSLSKQNMLIIFILFVVNLLNYIDRYTLAGVLLSVKNYFSISDGESGLLQTVFICSYMLLAPLFGYLGDRYSRKWIIIFGISFWSLMTFLGSFVPPDKFWLFAIIRSLVGIGEASYSCVAPTIIGDLFTDDLRTTMLAVFYLAVPVGSGLGYIVGSNIAKALDDWRWALRVTPPLGLVCILLLILIVREPKRGECEGSFIDQNHTNLISDVVYLLKK
jgi:hypothetical protein